MLLIAQHLWELILFLIVLSGPIPLCLSLAGGNSQENSNSSIAHFLLVILTGWISVQLLTGLVLGSLNILNLPAVIIAQIVFFSLGILAINYIKNQGDRTYLQIPQLKQPLNKWELLIISAATFAGCVLLGILTTKPTTNYDSLWFHLPAIARWYQTGSFTLLDPSGNWMFEHEQARIYPYNWHVLSLLCVLPFREDFLATFPLLISWVLQGLAIYLVSVKFGANRIYSMAASCLVLTVPMLLNQVNTIHPDLPLSAIFTIGLYFGISYYRSRAASELALCLATAGILAGIKITGLVYAVGLLAGLAILEFARFTANKKSVNSQTVVKTNNVLDDLRAVNFGSRETKNKARKFEFNLSKLVVLCGIVCLLFFGGFWSARNLMQINYPASAPAGVQVPLQPVQPPPSPAPEAAPQPELPAGKSVPISSPYLKIWHSTLAAQFNPLSIAHWQTLGLQIIIRLQLPFIAIALQSLAAIPAWIKSRNWAIGEDNIILMAVLAGTGILYLITPYSSGTEGNWSGVISPLLGFNLRYGFPFLSLLGIAAAAAATKLKTSKRIVIVAVIASSFLGIVSNTFFDIIRDSSFTGKSIVWGSFLIDTFKSNHGEAFNVLNKSLADRGLELAVYPVVGLGLTLLVVWMLSLGIPELNWSIERSRRNIKNLTLAIALFTLILLVASASLVARERRDVARTELYRDIYGYIDKNAAPDERIGFFFSSRSYLFYGKNLNREVLYVPFKSDVLADWLADLRQNKVGMVAIGPLTKANEQTVKNLSWMASSEGPLETVFGKEFLTEPVLYRLK